MDVENPSELLSVRLFFARHPTLAPAALTAALRQHFAQVDNPDNGHVYFFPEYQAEFSDGKRVPVSVMFTTAEGLANEEALTPALQQTWHWSEAADVLSTCRYEVIVTDFMTRTLPYARRVELFQKVLDAVVPVLQPQALYFLSSQKIVEPAAYLARDTSVLEGLLSVRFFNIANSDAQEMFMDTLGLYALGLPDFQIRFVGLDPGKVAGALTGYAYYLFENGPVIEDGNTIQGLTPTAKWHCYYEDASIEPARVVLQLETE